MTPIRTCAACGDRAPQRELVRFGGGANGLVLDAGRRRPGRGAYLHASASCWTTFVRRGGPIRSLRIGASAADRMRLIDELRQQAGRA